MKKDLLVLTLALSSLNAFATNGHVFTCSQFDPSNDRYHITINVNSNSVDVLQSSMSALFGPIHLLVEAAGFQSSSNVPEFTCYQTVPSENNYSISVKVFKDRVQVF